MARVITARAQRRAARVAGAMFLLALTTAAFNQLYVRFGLMAPGDAAATANNILASQQLFRVGIVSELLAVASAVVLSVALFVLLRGIGSHLALVGLAWRLAECAALGISSLFSLLVLLLLSGSDYATAFEAGQRHALVSLLLSAHAGGYHVALVFFGLGSGVFAYLFLKSGYVPRILAVWGVLASILVLVGALGAILHPGISSMGWFAPVFVFELLMGLLLVIRGLDDRSPKEPSPVFAASPTPDEM